MVVRDRLFALWQALSSKKGWHMRVFEIALDSVHLFAVLVVLLGMEAAWGLPAGGGDAGRIQERLREQIPREDGAPVDVPLPGDEFVPGADVKGVGIQRVRLKGHTLGGLEDFVASQLESELTLADLGRLVRAIEQFYRQRGYGLVRVIIPEQSVVDGEITLEVIEGFIERVEVKPQSSLGRLQGYVDNLLRERPLRLMSLERNLLLMNEIAGHRIVAALKPGQERGGVVLVLERSYRPVGSFFEVNSWGTEAVGPVTLQSGVFLNSLGGQGERVTLVGAVSLFDFREVRNFQLGFEVPVGNDGWFLYSSANYSKTQPGGVLRPFQVQGEAFAFRAGVRYGWMRSVATQVDVLLGFDLANNSSLLRFVSPQAFLYLDRTRNIELGTVVRHRHPQGRLAAALSVSGGLAGLGTRRRGSLRLPLSNQLADGTGWKVRGVFSHDWFLPHGFNWLWAGTFQWADRPLVLVEQFGIGGRSFNSAYRSSELVGDSGYAFRSELGKLITYRLAGRDWATQPYLFADYGRVFRYHSFGEQDLASVGFGFRQNFANVQFRLELGFPLVEINDMKRGIPQLHFSLQGVF